MAGIDIENRPVSLAKYLKNRWVESAGPQFPSLQIFFGGSLRQITTAAAGIISLSQRWPPAPRSNDQVWRFRPLTRRRTTTERVSRTSAPDTRLLRVAQLEQRFAVFHPHPDAKPGNLAAAAPL